MLYLVFASGALHGSEATFEKALALADELVKKGGKAIKILCLHGARWCSVDEDGNVHETVNVPEAHRPEAPAPAKGVATHERAR